MVIVMTVLAGRSLVIKLEKLKVKVLIPDDVATVGTMFWSATVRLEMSLILNLQILDELSVIYDGNVIVA